MKVIDTHAHLDELPDLPQALEEARKVGVEAIVAVGMDLTSNRRTLAIASEYPGFVFAAIGYHPWEIRPDEVSETLAFIDENLGRSVALGEVGLDYKARVKKELQREVFGRLIEMALRHRRPLILHCRYSHRRVLSMVREAGVKEAVFHWYTGPLELLEEILEAGYYISATPALTYSPPHRAAVAEVPIDRLLLETDTPVAYRGLEARPHHVALTLREVSRIKGLPPEEVARQSTENALRLFGPSGLTLKEELK